MDSLRERLMYYELGDLVNLYSEAQDNNNTDNQELVELYNHELEYCYGEGNLKCLDFAQLEYIRLLLEKVILYKV
jgi:hypothetical protein